MNIVSNAKQFLVGTFWHSNPVWSKIATIFLGFVVVVLSCVIALQAINSSDPDAQPGFVGLDSSSDIPDLYTGELVDLDKDGTPDVALFGSPEGPTIVTQVGDANPWTQSRLFSNFAFFIGTIVAVLVGVVVGKFLGRDNKNIAESHETGPPEDYESSSNPYRESDGYETGRWDSDYLETMGLVPPETTSEVYMSRTVDPTSGT